MPADLKTGIVRHALETSMMFLRNAALKHGIAPMPTGVTIADAGEVSASTAAPTANTGTSTSAKPAISSALKTAGLVGLSLLAGGGLGGLALAPFLAGFGSGQAASSSSQVLQSDKSSPLQWLEDQGLNVTPEEASDGK